MAIYNTRLLLIRVCFIYFSQYQSGHTNRRLCFKESPNLCHTLFKFITSTSSIPEVFSGKKHSLVKSQFFPRDGADSVILKKRYQPVRIRHAENHTGHPVLLSENRIHIFHVNLLP